MIINCKETARLLSESHDRRLSAYERIKLRMHLAMCVVCRNFSKQLDLIRKLARALGRTGLESPLTAGAAVLDQSLPTEAKSRIKKMLWQDSK